MIKMISRHKEVISNDEIGCMTRLLYQIGGLSRFTANCSLANQLKSFTLITIEMFSQLIIWPLNKMEFVRFFPFLPRLVVIVYAASIWDIL